MKICIIKLGALGDVVRTTPILAAIKEKYPESEITWITKPSSADILAGNNNIDQILTIPITGELGFDILYSLDIEEEATKLANQIKATEKYGYYDVEGFPTSFNPEAEYYLNTVFDDELKKSNRKTYQEMIFDVCKLTWKKQETAISIPEESNKRINDFLEKNDLSNKKLLGLNLGSSKRWPSKAWHSSKVEEFIPKAKEKGYEIILLGGSEEVQSMDKIDKQMKEKGIKVYSKNTSESLKDFFALIDACETVVCADTLALHVALGLEKKVVALFFCTADWEIEGYEKIKKIVSPLRDEFFPEKMDLYDETLVKSINVEKVLEYL